MSCPSPAPQFGKWRTSAEPSNPPRKFRTRPLWVDWYENSPMKRLSQSTVYEYVNTTVDIKKGLTNKSITQEPLTCTVGGTFFKLNGTSLFPFDWSPTSISLGP